MSECEVKCAVKRGLLSVRGDVSQVCEGKCAVKGGVPVC